ncbi:MAG: glycoside hydrolase family 2 protein [Clostridia bacterium]|nr:glycoside hydrolase family 2 protein [Clostridia bacterium]
MKAILNINSGWLFIKDTAQAPDTPDCAGERIDLPHTWNAQDGQDGGNDYFRGSCCYVRKLLAQELPQGDKYYLEINGANSSADVYLNGKKLAHHDGGYSTWRVELTQALEQENCLAIIVDNAANEHVYPQVADFTFYGGLYRDVNVIAVGETHFDLAYYGGCGLTAAAVIRGGDAVVELAAYAAGLQAGDEIRFTVLDAQENAVAQQTAVDGRAEVTIRQAHLWDGVKDPYLYTAEAVIQRGGETLDRVTARFGCRSYEIDPERGFILNGREYPLRGVSRHQDRLGIGNALLPEHHREDMDLICEVGANTIRLAHYQHDQYFYDLCDERGMIVWAEIPYISRHMPDGRENTLQQMRELIVQNYNHPSIVVWGLSNEITMAGAKDPDLLENHRLLNDLCHEMDRHRLTTLACITMCSADEEIVHLADVVSYNHYFGWYGGDTDMNGPWFDEFHASYPNRPIGCSEYGCEALNWHNSNPQQGDYSEEYQAYYHEELIKQLFSRPYLWATHVWNMFDFGADARAEGGENGQNHKGLVTFDRKYKKDAFYAYKAWLSDEPFVHICSKRYVDRVESVTKVTVYSNLPEVELFANGVSLGKKSAPDHFFRFDVPNDGETALLAVAGAYRDESFIRRVETMNMDYILREQGAVLNWFDITPVEGYFSLNDKLGDIMKTLRGKLFFAGLMLKLVRKMMGKEKPEGQKKKREKRRSTGMKMSFGKKELKQIRRMVSSFTVLRMTSMVGMMDVSFTKEELLAMNRTLNRIKKPE